MVAVPGRALQKPPESRVLPGARAERGAMCKPSKRPARPALVRLAPCGYFARGPGSINTCSRQTQRKPSNAFLLSAQMPLRKRSPHFALLRVSVLRRVTETPKRLSRPHSAARCVPQPPAQASRPRVPATGHHFPPRRGVSRHGPCPRHPAHAAAPEAGRFPARRGRPCPPPRCPACTACVPPASGCPGPRLVTDPAQSPRRIRTWFPQHESGHTQPSFLPRTPSCGSGRSTSSTDSSPLSPLLPLLRASRDTTAAHFPQEALSDCWPHVQSAGSLPKLLNT